MRVFFKKVILGFSIFSALKASVEDQRVVTFNAAVAQQQNTIAEFVEDYWKGSRLRLLDKRRGDQIKEILLKLPKWPGGETVRTYEKLSWLYDIQNRNYDIEVKYPIFQCLVENLCPVDFKKNINLKRRYPALKLNTANIICIHLPKSEDQDMFIEWLKRFGFKLEEFCFTQVSQMIKIYKNNSDDEYFKKFAAFYDRIDQFRHFQAFNITTFLSVNEIYNGFKNDAEREQFLMWIDKNTSIETRTHLDFVYAKEIYCAFDTKEDRDRFFVWGNKNQIKNFNFYDYYLEYKNIYCSLKTDEERSDFITWANDRLDQRLYKGSICDFYICLNIDILKEIYFMFSNKEQRNNFMEKVAGFSMFSIRDSVGALAVMNVYRAFKMDEERNHFLGWLGKIGEADLSLPDAFLKLKDLYCAFETHEELEQFTTWVQKNKIYLLIKSDPSAFLKIFREPHARLIFFQFYSITGSYLNFFYIKSSLVGEFVAQDIILLMRTVFALMAEPGASDSRKQSIREVRFLDELLPALNPADPFMQRIINRLGFTNVHTLEAYYVRDAALLSRIVESRGYNDDLSDAFLTVYNGQEINDCYQTDSNVMDFLEYLETEFKEDQHPLDINGHKVPVDTAIHLVKELLGIAPRELSTGAYGSYLARPMLYGTPTAITGDVLLGQIWHLIKTSLLPQESQEVLLRESSSRKRSVVLALLNGVDFDAGKADIRCQTRITGELLEMACFYLGSESRLRRFIADGNDVDTSRPENIEQRIADAPMKAKRIFDAVKESPRFIELYTESDKPELFELYMCYYDALYQGKTIIGKNGIARREKDEHVLERDASGNMVSRYNADGSVRENPIIVYYQAEFAIIELEFTKFLKREFHENRGLIY